MCIRDRLNIRFYLKVRGLGIGITEKIQLHAEKWSPQIIGPLNAKNKVRRTRQLGNNIKVFIKEPKIRSAANISSKNTGYESNPLQLTHLVGR